MRKMQKKKLLELVDTLSEAHAQLKTNIKNGAGADALSILQQCQECAVSMGEAIEKSEGEGFVTVKHLEDYCERLYYVSQDITGTGSIGEDKEKKTLDRLLNNISNSINNDIPEQTEAVFLPYKASMWDSLESLWKKEDADPCCDAYVIPIPYFDKNPDGSVREEHYEGAEYPPYVPIMNYTKYDFDGRHPDRIYIHNPYDRNNYVTSVHPFFYSENLKKYTDELIYIPYFVLADPDPDDEKQIEGISHFIVTPAVINADKVIVQSEAMRKTYIKVMTDYAGSDSRRYWEEKISGEGSPKIDRIRSINKEDIEMPEEWAELIKKPDGSRKKLIMYNTSVQALLDNGTAMLDKIEDVLRVFRENGEYVTLLWRPHPLIKATISSMRPELLERYIGIVDKYRKEGWGIYDDSADLDRAIVLSDAYYGDRSSVVELYKTTGKPIMIQNAEIIEKAS